MSAPRKGFRQVRIMISAGARVLYDPTSEAMAFADFSWPGDANAVTALDRLYDTVKSIAGPMAAEAFQEGYQSAQRSRHRPSVADIFQYPSAFCQAADPVSEVEAASSGSESEEEQREQKASEQCSREGFAMETWVSGGRAQNLAHHSRLYRQESEFVEIHLHLMGHPSQDAALQIPDRSMFARSIQKFIKELGPLGYVDLAEAVQAILAIAIAKPKGFGDLRRALTCCYMLDSWEVWTLESFEVRTVAQTFVQMFLPCIQFPLPTDNRWGQESWQEDSGTGWGQESWQQDSRGSGWQDSRQEEPPSDPWASYLANKGKAEEADSWSSQGNHRSGHRQEADQWSSQGNHRGGHRQEDDRWGSSRGQEDHHGSYNDRGGRQDSWGGSRGRRSHNEDSWQDDSWNHRQQDSAWNHGQRQDDRSRQSRGQDNRGGGRGQASQNDWHSRNGRQQEDLWEANWGQDNRRSGRQEEDRGGWSAWDRPPRNEDSSTHDSWNRDNRHDDHQAWGQNSWDKDASDPWANWDNSGGGQDPADDNAGGFGKSRLLGFLSAKDKDWDGVNQWATQLLEQGDVDWTTRPQIEITKDFYQEIGDDRAKSRSKEEIDQQRTTSGIEIVEGDSDECPVPGLFNSFDEMHWPSELQDSLVEEFEAPTPIQKQIWPLALQGRDVVGIAETGSGKTVSYVLPMIIHISRQEELEAGDGPVGLVLAPTRELAKQIERVCQKYGSLKRLASATIVGGMKTSDHKELLQARNDIIVATPGRFLQALGDEWTKLNRCTFVVLDEADELLEHKGFGGEIRAILTQVRKERQVLMFSATWPEAVKDLAREICTASDGQPPVHIRIGGTRLAACKSIVQRAEIVDDDVVKFERLKEKLDEMGIFQEGSADKCIIFCRSRNAVIKLKDMLSNEHMVWRGDSDCLVEELHGEMQQTNRDWNMQQFRDGSLPCVVATGVLARGHDIPQVKYVVNYDMPKMAEDYIHRVGRTGRAGHTGYAFTFVNRSSWQELQWGHEYLLGVLAATEQNVDETLQEAIDAHRKAAESKDEWWEEAGAKWNSSSGDAVDAAGEVLDVEFDEGAGEIQEAKDMSNDDILQLARSMVGEYTWHSVYNGQTAYKKTASSNGHEMFLYYFDDGEDPQSVGWYIGSEIAGDGVFAWSASLETGWHVPFNHEDVAAGFTVKRRQAQAREHGTPRINRCQQEFVWQEYYDAGHGSSAADFVQAYQAQAGVSDPKARADGTTEPSTLNSSALEFTPLEYQNQAKGRLVRCPGCFGPSGVLKRRERLAERGCFQGDIPAEMDPAAAVVGYDYVQPLPVLNQKFAVSVVRIVSLTAAVMSLTLQEHYAAADMSQAYYDQNGYGDESAAMYDQAAAFDQSAFYDPAATYEAAEMSAFANNTQRPPPGLEEENVIPATGCEVEAEPFVLAQDEVAMQAQPHPLNGKEPEEPSETSPDQECSRTGLVDFDEAEEPADDPECQVAKPEEQALLSSLLAQTEPEQVSTEEPPVEAELKQAVEGEDGPVTAPEAQSSVQQEMNTSTANAEAEAVTGASRRAAGRAHSDSRNCESASAHLTQTGTAEKPLDLEPAAEKAIPDLQQLHSCWGWSTFWDGTGQDHEAKVEAVPENCEVFNIDKNPAPAKTEAAEAAEAAEPSPETEEGAAPKEEAQATQEQTEEAFDLLADSVLRQGMLWSVEFEGGHGFR
ncbi:DBP2 [Symbiodinium sp. CCMP2592]|nr:DBP2 [Symbiodinium sp. CCMP2592]